ADRNRSHWSTSKTPSYTKSVSWQHHLIFITLFTRCHRYRNRHINTARAIAMGAIFKELL
ncbi:hypothetical protein SJ062_12020, partial [Escherichia coli]|uniref:hypothetical protein n=1 Tax=Escherichia coli TaxID=562 RepID=UPI0029D4374D